MDAIYEMLDELRPECDFHASSNYIEDGLLDSFDVISLVTMLEEKYEIMIDALDILPENFESAEALSTLVEKSGGSL